MNGYKLIHEKYYGTDGKMYTIIYVVDEDEINKFSKEEIKQMKERQNRTAACHIESAICGRSKL